MIKRCLLLVTLIAASSGPVAAHLAAADAGPAANCVPIGAWLDPVSGRTVPHQQLVAELVHRPVVLLRASLLQ